MSCSYDRTGSVLRAKGWVGNDLHQQVVTQIFPLFITLIAACITSISKIAFQQDVDP